MEEFKKVTAYTDTTPVTASNSSAIKQYMSEEQFKTEREFLKQDGDGFSEEPMTTFICGVLDRYKSYLIKHSGLVSKAELQKAFEDGVAFSDAFESKVITDQEIDEASIKEDMLEYVMAAGNPYAIRDFARGAIWYREQLNKKQD